MPLYSPARPGGSDNAVQFNDNTTFGGFGSWDGSLLTVPGSVSAADGEVGDAAYRFTSDPNLGLFRDVSDTGAYGAMLGFGMSGADAPSVAPDVALGATGVTTNGAHQFFVTFTTAEGETTVSPVASITISATKNVDLSNIPTGLSRVVDRNLYATKAGEIGAANAHLFAQVGDNTTTDYTFDLADADLTGDAPPTANTTGIQAITLEANTPGVVRLVPSGHLETLNNIAIGVDSLYSNTEGEDNVAIGFDALTLNSVGNSNVAIGRSTLRENTEGTDNVALGIEALGDNTEGARNVAVGQSALSNNTTGSDHVGVGSGAGPSSATLENTISIGAGSHATVSDTAVIGALGLTDVYFGGVDATAILHSAGLVLSDGSALRSDTTTAHTALLQAYDVNGTAYKTFGTLLNGDVPDFTIAPPSGGTVTLQATTFKSSDGTSGATAGPFTVVTAIQTKNGLVTTLTGTA